MIIIIAPQADNFGQSSSLCLVRGKKENLRFDFGEAFCFGLGFFDKVH